MLSSSNETSITASSNHDKHDNQAAILESFFLKYGGIELEEELSDFKQSNIKEETAQYVATQNRFQSCSEFWNMHKDHLPILSSFVRKYKHHMCDIN